MPVDTAIPAAAPASAAAARPGRVAFALILLALTVASGAAMQTVFSPVQEFAKAEMALDDIKLSMLQGLAASLPIAALSIPLGWMVDRQNRIWLLIAMATIWTVGTIATAFVDGFAALFAARMLAGLGATCCLPVVISIAADLCSPETRGRSMLLLTMGKVVGGAVAFAVGGGLFAALAAPTAEPILGLAPWRSTHLLFGIASAVLILPLFLLREPERKEVGEPGGPIGAALKALWGRRRFLAPLFIGQIGVVMADASATIWAAPVLTRSYGLQPAQFAGWMGLAILAAGVLGAVIGGVFADVGHKRDPGRGILLGAVIAGLIAMPMALFPVAGSVAGFAVMIALLLLCGTAAGLITATAIAVLVPNEIRGLCLGAFVVVGGLVGLGLAPTLVTFGSQWLGGEHQLGLSLAITGTAASVMSFVAFVMAWRAAPASATAAR